MMEAEEAGAFAEAAAILSEPGALALMLIGAFASGFANGFGGFGTALVASGVWFLALPPAVVPPLVAVTSIAAHLYSIAKLRNFFDWRRARPFLIGGVLATPLGVAALSVMAPDALKLAVGVFLVAYALVHLALSQDRIPTLVSRPSWDGAVGAVGGFFGGLAGLCGAWPLIWLQLQRGGKAHDRAIYQPYNTVILALAAVVMAAAGLINGTVLLLAAACAPLTLLGAALGARVFFGISEAAFRRAIVVLLFISGCVLVAPSL